MAIPQKSHTRGFLSRHRILFAGIVLLVAVLVGLRLALPSILKHYVNKELQNMDTYIGSVQEIDVKLWRGAYEIQKIIIEKRAAKRNEAFFAAHQLQISLQWPALWHGRLVGKARFDHAELNLVQSDDKKERQLGNDHNWNETLSNLFPFTFNEVSAYDSTVRFRAPGIKRNEALVVSNVRFLLKNLTNVFRADQAAYASFDLHGSVLGHGVLQTSGKLDPHAKKPQFEIAAEVKNVQLPQLNPWLETYAGVSAKDGEFSVYSEFAAADGRFKGYVKPIAKDLDVTTPKEDKDNIFRRAWTGIVELAANIFKNQPKDQLATRIPFSGSTDDPDADVLATIVNILRNAFVRAFTGSLEHSVNLREVSKDKNDDEDSDKKKE